MNVNEDWPRISVVTPSFNQGEFIERTIKSVLGQNYPKLEYFVIDGGSSDNTLQIIKRYENQITKWVSEPDDGQGAAIYKGFQWSSGDILCWLNSDDCLEPGALKFVGDFFANHPEIDWIIANDIVEIDGWSYPNIPNTEVSLNKLLAGQILYQDSVFFRKSIYSATQGINTELWGAIDYDLWLQFLLKGNQYKVVPNYTLSRFVMHPDQKSSDSNKYLKETDASRKARTSNRADFITSVQVKLGQKSAGAIRSIYQMDIPGTNNLLSALFPRAWYFHHSKLPKFKRVTQGTHDVACPLCHSLATDFHLSTYDNRFNQPGLYEIAWCRNCDLGITRPQLSKEELTKLYEKFYSNAEDHSATEPVRGMQLDEQHPEIESTSKQTNSPQINPVKTSRKSIFQIAKQFVRKRTSSRPVIPEKWQGKLLDFGCNDGEQLEIYKTLGQFSELCGFDINPVAVQRADAKGFDVCCGDLSNSQWPDHSFDVIVLSQVIEHLPDPVSVLKSLHQKLKPDGHLLVTCPNAHSFWAKMFGIAWSHWHVPYHLFHYTPASISKLGAEAGFKVEGLTTRSPAYWLFLSQHLQRYYARGEYLEIPIYPQPSKWTGFQAAFLQLFSMATVDRLKRGEMISVELTPTSTD